DGDDNLDLAIGNYGQVNQVYENKGGTFNLAWESLTSAKLTQSVAWGDWDGDGDLDLAVGNNERNNQVYENDGGTLSLGWEETGDTRYTASMAWGDWDNDGDLDLVAGNNKWYHSGCACFLGISQVYQNHGGELRLDPANGWGWQSPEPEARPTASVAWGDWDDDGDLDLAVGNWGSEPVPNQIYENDGGVLTLAWTSPEAKTTTSLAWGDWDGDGDLDLAVGNGDPEPKPAEMFNQVYENDAGTLKFDPDQPDPAHRFGWQSPDEKFTRSVAWGDWDNDGDLDLAVGNGCVTSGGQDCHPNQVFENDGGTLKLGNGFGWEESPDDINDTRSVAWGDWDNDGDLDLAVANEFYPNQVYENDAGTLKLDPAQGFGWQSVDAFSTWGVAWGDWEGDGDLDLAVSNTQTPKQVYENDGGILKLGNGFGWQSADTTFAFSMAWGDWEGDGDLDLTFGNWRGVNQVYESDGGTLKLDNDYGWESPDAGIEKRIYDIAWGDPDGDGDLDLAVANGGDCCSWANQLYENPQRGGARLGNDAPYVTIFRPGVTPDAAFFSTPHIMSQSKISITYTLFDPDGDPVSRIIPEFSPNGGGQWLPASFGPGGDGLINLAASPTGTPHTFVWNAEADLIKNDNVVFRIRAQPSVGPIQWPALDGKSPSFRLTTPQFIRVVDQAGTPVPGAEVYRNGVSIGLTNQAGLFNPGPLQGGDSLVALAQQDQVSTIRQRHDGWAYRTYLTSIDVDAAGNTAYDTVSQTSGEQRLVVRPENALVLFNLLVSIEWDATQADIDDVELALDRAAGFLYDVSDGQMTFGRVTIYDQAEHWDSADIQITTKNVVHPHAHIGGLTADDPSHIIRVGRFWNGNTANTGAWSEENGFRTLVHEFGHYGLGLYDEYFGYRKIGNQYGGRQD
ncbi:MAG: VCBS repeat-containing protein, partial [Gammaproteobacteria bacterium]|nr:VCBS repeat-containing protein [Gammaproteobacteria bacterium]